MQTIVLLSTLKISKKMQLNNFETNIIPMEKKNMKKTLQRKLDTIEDPQNNHTIQDQGGSWAIPLKKMFGRDVFMGVK